MIVHLKHRPCKDYYAEQETRGEHRYVDMIEMLTAGSLNALLSIIKCDETHSFFPKNEIK